MEAPDGPANHSTPKNPLAGARPRRVAPQELPGRRQLGVVADDLLAVEGQNPLDDAFPAGFQVAVRRLFGVARRAVFAFIMKMSLGLAPILATPGLEGDFFRGTAEVIGSGVGVQNQAEAGLGRSIAQVSIFRIQEKAAIPAA